ncbi:Retrovirus-related Pol polyprotein from transposon 17.6, partial [Mucuna pruriens]
MNHVFRSLIGKCVLIYFDDILVYSTCLNDHLLHVRSVLEILRKETLYDNLEKFIFCTHEVIFLGYVVGSHGVKDRLIHAPILAHPNFAKSIELECDSYNVGIEFVIHSDRESLKHLKAKRHAKWIEFLEQFPYSIKHKQGKMNIVVNSLSRRYALIAMLETKLLELECLKVKPMPFCMHATNDDYFRHDGFLFKERRLCLSRSSIRDLLVKEAHKGALMAHFDKLKTYEILFEHFFWPYMRKYIHH